MRKAIAVLCVGALLSGCSTVGNVLKKTGQVLMDPGIQVGTAEDQPTRVALSLYAGMNVNPNPVAEEDIESESDVALDEGPYAINLHSETREELVRSLRAVLDYLQEETSSLSVVEGHPDSSDRFELNLTPNRPPFIVGSEFDLSSPESVATSRAPFPPHWQVRRGGDAQGASPRVGDDAGRKEHDVDLGQYREGVPLAPAAPPERLAHVNATPIAFRVIQLKDDSLLENADPDLVRSAPKKALGSTYLTADDYLLVPGQFKFINYSDLDEDTRYVAVVAAFHDPNAQRWYDVFRVEPRGRRYALLVTLQDTQVAITDESYRPAQGARRPPIQTRKQP